MAAKSFDVGAIAQLGERVVRNDEVSGSIPLGSTNTEVQKPRKYLCTCGALSYVGPQVTVEILVVTRNIRDVQLHFKIDQRKQSHMRLYDQLPQELKAQIDRVRNAAIAIWHSPLHAHYTDHKPESHSERIIEKLDAMAESIEPLLTSQEVFVLLAATYLHDIGMQRRLGEQMTLEEVRENHHLASKEMIEGSISNPSEFPRLNLEPEYVDEVALVAAAHRRLDLTLPEFEDRPKGGGVIRLRLLSAMLRLGDALDLDARRVLMDNLKLQSVSTTSRVHWWRCHYVEGLVIRNGDIQISCAVPNEVYKYYLQTSIENEVRAELQKMQPFLWPQVKLTFGSVPPRVSATKQAMSDADFALLRQQVNQEVERSSILNAEEMGRLRRFEENAAHQAALEGQRLSGPDPPSAIEHLQRAAVLFERLGLVSAAASQLESIATLHEAAGEMALSADLHEHIGLLHLHSGDTFAAKWAFDKAHNQTPVEEAEPESDDGHSLSESRSVQVRRGLLEAQARCLQGEFGPVDAYLHEVAVLLQSRPSPLAVLLCQTRVLFFSLLNEWQAALFWARHLGANSQDATPQDRAVFGYEMAPVAFMSGEHDLARQWLSWAFDYHGTAATEDHQLGLNLHARRGWIQWRAGEDEAALEDFRTALQHAEALEDDLAVVAQFQNAWMVAGREEHNPYDDEDLAHRFGRIQSLAPVVRHERGPSGGGGKKHQADNLAAHLLAHYKARLCNDIVALRDVQKGLANIYSGSNRLREAIICWVLAGDSEQSSETMRLRIRHDEHGVGGFVCNLLNSRPSDSPAEELHALATVVQFSAEYLSPDVVATTAQRFVNRLANAAIPPSLEVALLAALESLAVFLPEHLAYQTARAAFEHMAPLPDNRWTVREAAAKLIESLALAKAHHLPDDLVPALVEQLSSLMDDSVSHVAHQALKALSAIELERAGVDPTQSQAIRDFIYEQAVREGHDEALQLCIVAGLGSVPDDVSTNLLNRFVEQLEKERQMMESKQFTLGGLSLNTLVQFAPLIRPGALPTEKLQKLFEGLLAAANHPDNIIAHRQSALYVLGHLAEQISVLQGAGDLPSDFLERVATSAFVAVQDTQVGKSQAQMAQGAHDPLNRFQVNFGKVSDLQAIGLGTLTRLCSHLPAATVAQVLELCVDQAGNTQTEMRRAAALSLHEIQGALDAEQKRLAVTQLCGLMHDGDGLVSHDAIFACGPYLSDIEEPLAEIFCRRLIRLAASADADVRLRAAQLLRRLPEHAAFVRRATAIQSALRALSNDPNARIRAWFPEQPAASS